MSKLSTIHTTADFRRHARKRLPRFVFDFVDGGAGFESALARNERAFGQFQVTPRIGINPEHVDTTATLFGEQYAAPYGIAPLGLCGLVHPRADIQLALTAAKFKLPYIVSATASTSVEEIAEATGSAPWFQLYAPKSSARLEQLIQRVDQLGCPVLVITVDTAAPGKRVRDLRNGLRIPYRPSLYSLFEAARHPLWSFRRISAGGISFPNLATPENLQGPLPFSELMSWQTGGSLDWEVLHRIRQQWRRKLVLKGVLSAADAKHAQGLGIDAVIISNHGGRQLDCAPSPISVLGDFVAKGLTPDFLMMDSGIRCGEDIIKTLALGAGFAFVGRPFLYALAAGGVAGAEHLIGLLMQELRSAMRLTGASSIGSCREQLKDGIRRNGAPVPG